jgi:hypothetical protein
MGARKILESREEFPEKKDGPAALGRGSRWRRWLANLLLLGFSMAITLSITEVLLHAYFPFEDTTLQLDPRYLHRFKPNSQEIYWFSEANGGKRLIAKVNAEGRRGELVDMDRPRILVYGDSFIAAMFSPMKEWFTYQLEQKLKDKLTPSPQVVNCGVQGYGPDQESLVMEDEIDRLKPRLIIISIYTSNDFGDLLRDKIYKLDQKMQLQDNRYTLDPFLVRKFYEAEHLPRSYFARMVQKGWQMIFHPENEPDDPTGGAYMDAALRDSQSEYKDYVIDGNNSVKNLLHDHYDADVSLTPNSDSAQYKRTLMDRVIEKMKRVADAHSVPLMLVIVPAPFDIVDNYAVTVDTKKYPEYRRSELSDIVEGIAQKYDIPYVNLYKPFREHGAASLYFVVDNDHWNAAGEQLAADLVADYIKQHRFETH